MKPKKIHVVADDLIFPNNSGGRAEVLGHTEALLAAGHQVTMTLMQREAISEEDYRKNQSYLSEVEILQRPGFIQTSLKYPLKPYQLGSRIFDRGGAHCSEKPDLVIAHHEYALPYATQISRYYQVPLYLRSHNDEIAYLESLYRGNKSVVKKAYFFLELSRSRLSFTRKFYTSVDRVLTISDTDQSFYQKLNLPVDTVPPSLLTSKVTKFLKRPKTDILVFAGTLDVGVTREGLKWFVEKVWPLVLETNPSARLKIMGRRAPDEFISWLVDKPQIDFLGEVESIEKHLLDSTIFINPIFGGSGVNMKVGPPASLGLPIVSTEIGVRGLEGLGDAIDTANTPVEFHQKIINILDNHEVWKIRSEKLFERIQNYSPQVIAEKTLQGIG